MIKKNKIALIGCGIWGKKILKDLNSLCCIIDVFDTDISRAEETINLGASKFNIGLPDATKYDGLVIATPSSTHRKIIEQLTPLTKPVFLEKPLATSYEDALALKKLANGHVFLMHIWLYHPGVLLLKEKAQSGQFGKILGVRSTRANWTSPRIDTDTVWNLSPHDITITKAILGHIPEPKAAVVEKHNSKIRGMTAFLGHEPYSIFEVSNRFERKIREVRVHCEKGVLILENEKVDYITIIHGNDESQVSEYMIEKSKFEQTAPLYLELEEFINYLNGGPKPRSDFNEGLEIIKTIHKLIEIS